jgi:hypothetical protein
MDAGATDEDYARIYESRVIRHSKRSGLR